MLKALRRVAAAVSSRDLIPCLTHFHVYGQRVQAGNGNVVLDGPFPSTLDMTVPAARFLAAIAACKGVVEVTQSATRVSIKSGKFRAWVPTFAQNEYPRIAPSGGECLPCPPLRRVLRTVYDFIGNDASRPWGCAVLLHDDYAWATMNTALVRAPLSWPKGHVVELPRFVVDELLTIEEEPCTFSHDAGSVTFYYADGTWLRSQLYSAEWPDVTKFGVMLGGECEVAPPGLLEAVENLLPFVKDAKFPVLKLSAKGLSTQEGDHFAEQSDWELPEVAHDARILQLVLPHATHVNFTPEGPNTFKNTETGVQGLFAPIHL